MMNHDAPAIGKLTGPGGAGGECRQTAVSPPRAMAGVQGLDPHFSPRSGGIPILFYNQCIGVDLDGL